MWSGIIHEGITRIKPSHPRNEEIIRGSWRENSNCRKHTKGHKGVNGGIKKMKQEKKKKKKELGSTRNKNINIKEK